MQKFVFLNLISSPNFCFLVMHFFIFFLSVRVVLVLLWYIKFLDSYKYLMSSLLGQKECIAQTTFLNI